ncbi:hypothetical protein P3X46_034411 [Hevea brasiliensis]|uniref:Translocon at the inner envelope membrane of chloroplasts 214 n=1 Tax=Hevea brasiliensis TaxID=3981 RepID=A0ABQ9K831_HEVBR|nr:hypothetical protein P3X46_034411 [Hevea brasiliensis]
MHEDNQFDRCGRTLLWISTTFSMGPSYLFLLRARVIEEGEEGTEKKVSETTGFITGQLMMFISIYYAPLHLALGRPHTITVLALPYLLFHFFWNNHKHIFDYGSTTRNSMRNLSIQFVFLNNLIFQLFNHFILPIPCVELRNSMARIFSILLFITCVYSLGRKPSPIYTKKLKETKETEESEDETVVEIEKLPNEGD